MLIPIYSSYFADNAISYSTPHLYISALARLPEESTLRPVLSCLKSSELITTGRNENWPSMLLMYSVAGKVRHVTFSADSKSIAACADDGRIYIFDAKTGVLEMKIQVLDGAVCYIAFSPDGKQLVAESADTTVTI